MEQVEFTMKEAEQNLFQGEVKVQGWVALVAMGLMYLKSKMHPAAS